MPKSNNQELIDLYTNHEPFVLLNGNQELDNQEFEPRFRDLNQIENKTNIFSIQKNIDGTWSCHIVKNGEYNKVSDGSGQRALLAFVCFNGLLKDEDLQSHRVFIDHKIAKVDYIINHINELTCTEVQDLLRRVKCGNDYGFRDTSLYNYIFFDSAEQWNYIVKEKAIETYHNDHPLSLEQIEKILQYLSNIKILHPNHYNNDQQDDKIANESDNSHEVTSNMDELQLPLMNNTVSEANNNEKDENQIAVQQSKENLTINNIELDENNDKQDNFDIANIDTATVENSTSNNISSQTEVVNNDYVNNQNENNGKTENSDTDQSYNKSPVIVDNQKVTQSSILGNTANDSTNIDIKDDAKKTIAKYQQSQSLSLSNETISQYEGKLEKAETRKIAGWSLVVSGILTAVFAGLLAVCFFAALGSVATIIAAVGLGVSGSSAIASAVVYSRSNKPGEQNTVVPNDNINKQNSSEQNTKDNTQSFTTISNHTQTKMKTNNGQQNILTTK